MKNLMILLIVTLFLPIISFANEKDTIAPKKDPVPIGAYKLDNKWHVIDKNGDLLFAPLDLYQIGKYGEGHLLAIILVEGRKHWAFFNMKGEKTFDFVADGVRPFVNGLAKFYNFIDNRKEIPNHGFYNMKGELVIEDKYLEASIFSEGTAWVMNFEERGWIDTTGKYLWKPEGEKFGLPFVGGFAVITNEEGEKGFINRNFELVIDYKYLEAMPFAEGLAMVRGFGEILYIDTLGNEIIKTPRSIAKPFHGGYAFTADVDDAHNPLWQVISKQGMILTDEFYKDVRNFNNGVAPVQDMESKKWKFIDCYGQKIFEKEFDVAEEMIDGMAWASDKEKGTYGWIDNSGEYVLQLPKADAYVDFRINKMLK